MSKDDKGMLAAVEPHAPLPGHALPVAVVSLEDQFNTVWKLFNNNDDPSIGNGLDPNVVVFSVSSNRPVIGIEAVKNFFAQQFSDTPKFTPLSPVTIRQQGITGTVDGSARWIDSNGAETISFVFTFVFENKKWMLLSLWGS